MNTNNLTQENIFKDIDFKELVKTHKNRKRFSYFNKTIYEKYD